MGFIFSILSSLKPFSTYSGDTITNYIQKNPYLGDVSFCHSQVKPENPVLM